MKKNLGFILFFVSLSAHAALQGRLPATPGGADCQAYFDEDLQITWTANANINGPALWAGQVSWASGLILGGALEWRLASIGELEHLYVSEGISAESPEPFSNVAGQPNFYWSGTTFNKDPTQAFYASFTHGHFGSSASKDFNALLAWAVHLGDPFENSGPPDTDCDGFSDSSDNCILIANADQRDTDGDGIGNICDADFNNDCMVNFGDLNIMKAVFFGNDPDSDLDGDGGVNFADLNLVKAVFFGVPGPSGLPNACD